MRVFSLIGFVLIIPILALRMGSETIRLDAVKGDGGKGGWAARALNARLARPDAGGVRTTAPAPSPTVWRGLLPPGFRPPFARAVSGRRPALARD